MPKAKVAVTLDATTLQRLDRLVRSAQFRNRSQAIEAAVTDTLARLDRRQLAAECAKLEAADEQRLADEGLGADLQAWPEY